MAAAMPSVFSSKLKLIEPTKPLIEGNKFIKWSEATLNSDKYSSTQTVCVNLKVDEKCFILYWRDVNNKKSEFLDIALIRDVKTGKYANIPKDKNTCDILMSGKSSATIKEKTITIYYGPDFVNLQSINFVSLAENAQDVAEQWAEFLFQAATNPKTQNLSPYENLLKLRTCLLYGKSVFDERTLEYRLPVQTIVDAFITNNKQVVESERQWILHALNHVNLPCGKADMIDEKVLTVDKFFSLFLRLISKHNDEIFKIFIKFKAVSSRKNWLLNAEKFEKFLNEEQRDPSLNELLYPFYTTEKAAELIQKFEVDESSKKKKTLTIHGLIRYLMDFENEIIDPIKYELYDDMEQPLSHYFINSSHNTYLTGHQITGRSDAEMYRQVLLSGCRCIELDCHEDEGIDEPIITHGRTLCTKILFKEAVLAIKESAFKTSPYPVLLSFENYCGKKMQEKMANYLIDILGDYLLKEPLPDFPLEPGIQLPSPEQLKYKILCKFRKKIKTNEVNRDSNQFSPNSSLNKTESSQSSLKSGLYSTNLNANDSEINENKHSLSSSSSIFSIPFHTAPLNSESTVTQPIFQASDGSDSEKEDFIERLMIENRPAISHRHPIKIKLTDSSSLGFNQMLAKSYKSEYSFKEKSNNDMNSLVNYLTPTTFRSFEASQKRDRSYEMSSFVETNAFNLHKEKPSEFVNYNKRQFSRIYPKGTRISSDNFIPQMFWNVGCQQVALNFQTLDLGMQLNLGKFEYNNKAGYLLKPEIMRRADFNKPFDPFAEAPLDGIVATTLSVTILNGMYLNGSRHDNDKRIGYSVNVELYGLPADSLRGQKAHRVKAAQGSGNSFFVNYIDNGFTFKKIIMPQLALLNLTVLDEQGKLLGRRSLPVVGLRPGYRYISLKNESNQPLNMCTLFVYIKIHDYVPEEYEEFASALVNPIDYVKSLDKKDEMLRRLQDENENYNNEEFEDDIFYEVIGKNYTTQKNEVSENDIELNFTDSPTVQRNERVKRQIRSGESLTVSADNLLESIDIVNSDLNNDDILREINLNYLKTSESYLQLSQKYFNKIERIDKDTEKKIYDLDQSLTVEISKLSNDSKRFVNPESKTSRLKQLAKKKIWIPFSKSSYSPNSLSPSSSSTNLEFDSSEINIITMTYRQKYVKLMMNTYIECFKEIYKLKIESIEPLFIKLKNIIDETYQTRIKTLKSINEKEILLINKSAHEEIKLKKKTSIQSTSDKDEINRIFKRIEKEAINLAASLTEKSNDLFKSKQSSLAQLIEKSINNLNDLKNKKLSIYKNELLTKINEKKQELEETFLKDSSCAISIDELKLDFDMQLDSKSVITFIKNENTYL